MAINNHINHVVFVLDASSSMSTHSRELIKVADGQIAHLARRSTELDQETRVTVYSFDTQVRCLVYDKDVLRLPSIATLYRTRGMTALIDATMQGISDLGETPERYGDHAFLMFVLTDGEENASHRYVAGDLRDRLNRLPEHWTVGFLVPDFQGVAEAKRLGLPPANVAVWNATSAAGVVEVGETIRAATENFMQARSTGQRSTRSLFSTGADAVNKATVSTLTPLTPGSYFVKQADRDYRMDEISPVLGRGFYRLQKREEIQAQKAICIRDKRTGQVYTGQQARDILGLPAMAVKVTPTYNPDYDVFVQSTAPNRKIPRGSEALVLR
jgi:hypothetical protein